jgi:hypothetical protein
MFAQEKIPSVKELGSVDGGQMSEFWDVHSVHDALFGCAF